MPVSPLGANILLEYSLREFDKLTYLLSLNWRSLAKLAGEINRKKNIDYNCHEVAYLDANCTCDESRAVSVELTAMFRVNHEQKSERHRKT
jgi:hypothetical protein